MSSEAITGIGTEFRRWDASAGAWEAIAEVLSIGLLSGRTRDVHEVATLDAAEGYTSIISGLRHGGECTFSMIFRRDTFEIMNDDFESDIIRNYEVVFPDDENTTVEFEGLVTETPLTVAPDAPIPVDVTIAVNGKTVIASGSGGTSQPSA
jgi:hypothetical protein